MRRFFMRFINTLCRGSSLQWVFLITIYYCHDYSDYCDSRDFLTVETIRTMVTNVTYVTTVTVVTNVTIVTCVREMMSVTVVKGNDVL